MATTLSAIRTGVMSYRLTATSDLESPVFRWFIDGAPYAEGTESFLDVRLSSDRQVTFSVADQDEDAELVVAQGVPSALVVWWTRRASSLRYLVQVLVDAEWETRETVQDTGLLVFSVDIHGLADETMHTIRIVAVDTTETEKEIAKRTAFLIRRPDTPSQSVEYDPQTGEVTIGG